MLDKPVISLDRAELHKIMVELSCQGNNLNQITRVLNERGDLAHENEISEMKGELEKTWQQLRQLIHTLA
ncbi:MAG: MobC family plasmid mobilization relaxosome protein [Lachnospiraceae bacterium]|nr:MobC family plasmid mobilization relaxosome protein [Lachnospiraceae bacterium]